MKTFTFQVLSTIFALFLSWGLYAQSSLDLFQDTESTQRSETTERRTQRNRETNSEPAFTLVGTSRFGNEYSVSLLSSRGESVNVEWTPGKVVDIEGYLNYKLASVGSRTASIRIPGGETCIASEIKGVRCNGNIAVLTLSNGAPIERRQSRKASSEIITDFELNSEILAENESGDVDSDTTIPGTNVLRRNPFSGELQTVPELTPEEQAARAQRRAERAEQFRNFEIVRIPDDEIPEGMRRVRSPFGDSLEPIED